MQLIFDTETDGLESVVATLAAAYGQPVTIGESAAPKHAEGAGRSPRRHRGGGSGRRRNGSRRASTAEVRAWAAAKGVPVGTHGRLPDSLWEQYEASK